jgi:hypothetical protein
MRSEGCSPPIWRSRSAEPGRDAGEPAIPLEGSRGHVDRGGQGFREALKPALHSAGLGKLIELAFRRLDLVARRSLDRRVVGGVHHLLADEDEAPARRQIVDRAAVILGIDDGRRLRREPREVLGQRQGPEIDLADMRAQRDGSCDLAGFDQRAGHLVDLAVDAVEEMLGQQEVGDPVIGVIVDQDGAEKRLLRLDVARLLPNSRWRRVEAVTRALRMASAGSTCSGGEAVVDAPIRVSALAHGSHIPR